MKKRKPDFGDKLRELTIRDTRTNKQLASELGISESTLYRWLKRDTKPNSDKGDFAARSIPQRINHLKKNQKVKSGERGTVGQNTGFVGDFFSVIDAINGDTGGVNIELFESFRGKRLNLVIVNLNEETELERVVNFSELEQRMFEMFRIIEAGSTDPINVFFFEA